MLDLAFKIGDILMAKKAAKKSNKKNFGDYASEQGLANAQGLAAALSNPQSQQFKQFEAEELDNQLMSYQQELQNLINQNRREQAMGRKSLFDEERGGEQIFKALTKGRLVAGQNARNAARQRIMNAYNANTGLINAGANVAEKMRERKAGDAMTDYYTYGGLAEAIGPYARSYF